MILLKIRNSKATKYVAATLAFSFLTELLQPLQLKALSGGPSQPEMAGFTPINTDNMVDLFSGDFHYSIPIMTVPGPNGGFPINLNYTSDVGMEHEASWVGLGWNLNPGAINRQVRGIPDDFNGDEISKTYKRRNNNTFIFTPSGGMEVFGADFGVGLSQSASFIYNTYHGMTLSRRLGISASYVRNGNVKNKCSKICTGNLGINLDSDNGVTTSFSMNGEAKNLKLDFNYGYNSKNGNFSFSNQISPTNLSEFNNIVKIGSSFSSAANLPPINLPLSSFTFATSGQVGGTGTYVEGYGNVAVNFSSQSTPDYPFISHAFGLLYADEGQVQQNSIQDFNREKEICVDEHSLNLPLPVMTNDIYYISGEQLVGSFRAYRPDYGYFFDNYINNITNTLDIGIDVSAGSCVQLGANLSDNFSFSETGKWYNGFPTAIQYKNKDSYYNHSGSKIPKPLYEPFYFKMSGEQTTTDLDYLQDIGGTQAVNFPIHTGFNVSAFGLPIAYYATNAELRTKNGATIPIINSSQTKRAKRTSSVEYKMSINENNNRKKHHISEFSIVNANGERYTYGKTLYNQSEKEVQFSIPYQNNIAATTTNNYTDGNANGTLRVGKEKLYSCTETPAYAYSYLLTQITSPDYVDANNNGTPDEADFGYWVKLSYTDKYSGNSLYKWRFPYSGANFFMGDRSNQSDDKGSYNYGTKEISYVSTIETKTHKAVFYISQRQDALGVLSELRGGKDNTQTLYKLDSIRLYSKEDLTTPIKTAVFEYDYSLCCNIPNSNNAGGKLTLKAVYFKYAANEKGTQNPYRFTYSTTNPIYNATMMDRWGNYKGDANYFEHYTTQNKTTADQYAQSWLLSKIDLPEGGSILIDYESDDYAYVQDKQATYMAKMTNTSFVKENGKYYIYFNKTAGISTYDYIKGFEHDLMFFKIASRYKSDVNPDYIQGYVKIDRTNTPENISATTGKIAVKAFSAYDMHPMYLLACQYLKNNRPDILFGNHDADENQSDAIAFFRTLVSDGVISEFKTMFGNDKFYRHCIKKGYYNNVITTDAAMPSYVRLNVPGKIKYGGGVRVKSISFSDNWSKSETSTYTQEYFYKTIENGKLISSGVAEYEPMVGAEENALRYPVYDEVRGLFFVEDEMYSETPYGESYYPGANVGYSKVTVRTKVPDNVQLSTAGIQVHEFYTAKDFPITVSQTELQIKSDGVPNVFSLLTAGFKQVSNSAFSQGYQIELNDMHGKQKALSTYPYLYVPNETGLITALATAGFTSKVEYQYKEKTENGVRKIDNVVEVLVNGGQVKEQILGQTYDFVIDQRENHSKSVGGGASAQFMLGNCYPPIPGASVMPSFDCFEESVRALATTKVIYNTGVLEKTIAHNNGSKITTTNLQWDPYTGQPLLTTVTNEFEKPVYNYSMPAYWYHPNMGSAAENYRAYFKTDAENDNYFGQYDKIILNNQLFRLNYLSNNTANCWTYSGNTNLSANGMEIIQSRNSNQLSAMAATISSLSNPVTAREFPLFDAFNSQNNNCFGYTDCSGKLCHGRIEYYNNQYYFVKNNCQNKSFCSDTIATILRDGCSYIQSPVIMSGPSVTNLYFYKQGNRVVAVQRNGTYAFEFAWNDPQGIFPECLDGVLQASATEYKPNWTYDYVDAGSTSVNNNQANYLGIPNIYRSLRANLFVTERKQEGQSPDYKSNVAYDGTFSMFTFFNYAQGNAGNMQKPWTWTAEITKYSPFNFEIENVNALGIYSSALYGYKNSLATAVANNARYAEIGFDGFENDANTAPGNQRGHIKCQSTATISTDYAHSGGHSLKTTTNVEITANVVASINQTTATNGVLTLQQGKQYLFSCWVRKNDCLTTDNFGNGYTFQVGNATAMAVEKEEKVDCWQRIEIVFTPTLTGNLSLKLASKTGGTIYVDDIRIMPANATLKSYVYDPANYRLIAELDENNYATFYNYDEEGILVQIKKETESGIKTVQTTRQNLKKNTH